jgi:hypothetical protein
MTAVQIEVFDKDAAAPARRGRRVHAGPVGAGVLSRDPWVAPIAGTSHRRWLEENAAASDIAISDATQQPLDAIFRPGAAAGARYPDRISRTLGI